jgi:hypothetical protein
VIKRAFCILINVVGFCVWKMHDIRAMKTNLDPLPNVSKFMIRESHFGLILVFSHFCFTVVNTFSERLSGVCGRNINVGT